MTDAMHERLCRSVDVSAMMAHLEEFARRVKLAGTPEEMESFRYIQSCLDGYGWTTNLLQHDAYISLPGKARITIGSQELRCITHSFSRPSAPEGTFGEIVYAGSGRAQDFAGCDVEGKIALLEQIANPGASMHASAAGAIGQIHISPHEHLHEMCISPVWGSPSDRTVNQLPSTVVVSIGKSDGDALKERLRVGETVRARLHAEVDTGWRKTPLLVADVTPDDDASDGSFVMFSGHHDTWHLGVMDNGTANATMLEVARLFAPLRRHMRRGLRLCFWSGHSQGRYSGSSWYADNYWADLESRCVAHVNIDSTGGKGGTVLTDAYSSAELYGLAAEAVREQGGQTLGEHRMSRAGDQSFWGIGIPSVFMAMGEQPIGAENVMGAILGGDGRNSAGFGWWWHTPDDTLDKIDPDLLARDARIYVHAIWRLVSDAILPLDYAAQVRALKREISVLESLLRERFDLAPVMTRIDALEQGLDALYALAESHAAPVEKINAALVAVSRALVPIDYTSGDRFEPDPAIGQQAYPALDPLRRLAAAPDGSDAARFLTVSARRAANRVSHALVEANKSLACVLRMRESSLAPLQSRM